MPLDAILVDRVLKCKTQQLDFQCGLMDADVDELVELLKQRQDITKIHLNQNNLSDIAVFKLIPLTWVTEYNFENNNISDKGAIALAACPHLDRVNLCQNRSITLKAWEAIAQTTQQTYLGVEQTCISEKLANDIAQRTANNLKQKEEKVQESKVSSALKIPPLVKVTFRKNDKSSDKENTREFRFAL